MQNLEELRALLDFVPGDKATCQIGENLENVTVFSIVIDTKGVWYGISGERLKVHVQRDALERTCES